MSNLMSLNLLDWIIIIIYLAGMITLSFFLAREAYFSRVSALRLIYSAL